MVSSFLSSPSSDPLGKEEISKVVPGDLSFAGFNLVLMAPSSSPSSSLRYEATLVTNYGSGGKAESRTMTDNERACGCCSNGIDGQGHDAWPKFVHGSKEFASAIATCSGEAMLIEGLFDVLR
jgi:hypothetical protein